MKVDKNYFRLDKNYIVQRFAEVPIGGIFVQSGRVCVKTYKIYYATDYQKSTYGLQKTNAVRIGATVDVHEAHIGKRSLFDNKTIVQYYPNATITDNKDVKYLRKELITDIMVLFRDLLKSYVK